CFLSTRSAHRGNCFSCLFFFSSRRRHTRFSRDWSSDVCSSDLLGLPVLLGFWLGLPRSGSFWLGLLVLVGSLARQSKPLPRLPRSEERRVGKECRSRWRQQH